MAEGEIARLTVTLEAATKNYERVLAKAQGTTIGALRKIEKEAAASGARIDGALAGGIGGLKQAAAALAGFAGFRVVSDELKRLADVSDDAQKIGITAELLQSLQFAAGQAGSSAEEMTRALTYFAKEAGESGDKSSKLAALFRENGVALRDAKGELLPYNDLLERFARLVANAGNAQDAAAIAAIGFGKAGAGMVPVLRDIAGGLDAMQAKAKEAGVVVAESLVQQAGAFDDAWSAAVLSVKAKLATLVIEAANVGTALAAAIRDAASSGPKDFGVDYDALGNPIPRYQSAQPVPSSGYTTGGGIGDIPNMEALREAARARALTALQRAAATKVPTTGGGGGDDTTAYERETEAIEKKIAALEVERDTVGQTTAAREKAKMVLDLTTAAMKANEEAGLGANVVTDAQKVEIEALAAKYGQLKQSVEEAEKAQHRMIEALDAVRSTAGSTLGTFLNDLAEGTSLMDALRSAVDSVRTALLNAFANQLVAALLGPTGTAGTGFLGAIFGGGRAAGGVMEPGHRYRVGERGPEEVIAMGRAMVRPIRAEPRRTAAGGSSLTFAPTIDARGADVGAVARIERALADTRAELDRVRRSEGRRAAGMRA